MRIRVLLTLLLTSVSATAEVAVTGFKGDSLQEQQLVQLCKDGMKWMEEDNFDAFIDQMPASAQTPFQKKHGKRVFERAQKRWSKKQLVRIDFTGLTYEKPGEEAAKNFNIQQIAKLKMELYGTGKNPFAYVRCNFKLSDGHWYLSKLP